MIDIVTTRSVAIQTHPPLLIFIVLFALAFACAGLTGYRASASEHPGSFYNILLAAVTACVLYLILDMEYPRYGLIRLDSVNRVLIDLVQTMRGEEVRNHPCFTPTTIKEGMLEKGNEHSL